MSWTKDIRIVVGLDFGTTYSGFTYCHVSNKNLRTHDIWPGNMSELKANTVLLYDDELKKVAQWGKPALSKRPSRRKAENKPVKLFKLHLGNLQEHLKPKLLVDYKKAITDYLHEIGKLIKETVMKSWPGIDFLENVLLVLTVPAEYSDISKATLRECVFDADLISNKFSEKLQFTTEPEAAAAYCMENVLKEHDLDISGTNFMIVDCGGGTVDLTTRQVEGKQLGEITERAGDYCGSTFIEDKFIEYLQRKLGKNAIELLEKNQYGQMQYMIQKFCSDAKLPFTGDPKFNYTLDLEEVSPALAQYVTGDVKESLEEASWLIKLDYETMKSMFDPVIDRIIGLIRAQLENAREKCSAMFLVGGFSQSKYLQKRIKKEFQKDVDRISVPSNPIAAISRGAAIYGVSFNEVDEIRCIISSRVLKFTYGIGVYSLWEEGDPEERRNSDGYIRRFHCIARRGKSIPIDKDIFVEGNLFPYYSSQTAVDFQIYYTRELDAKFCDETGMEPLGKLRMDLPDPHRGCDRPLTFGLKFGRMEITATAINDTDGQNYQVAFDIETEN
ncbi:actin-like ATPase domain-containing protein [Rhizophagus irregularis]|uniref:Actin-like ATPase domain-containing protein n=1 Tax=Rhizophagus irregularis TaxID=588596 RepID=A0A2N1MRY0_9GLOM|nr:actin-like ATPase domain-containing protein [Rhizophagus irregularis]